MVTAYINRQSFQYTSQGVSVSFDCADRGLGFMYLQKSIILLLVGSLLLQAVADLVLLIQQMLTPTVAKDMQHD